MASKKKAKTRVEPSFQSKSPAKSEAKTTGKSQRKSNSATKAKAKSRSGTNRRQTKSARGKAQKPSLLVRFFKSSVYWCFVLGIWGAIGVGSIFAFYGAKMPSAKTWDVPQRPPNVQIMSYDGQVIANRGITGGQALFLSDMSPYIPQAVIAIEDRRFYSHFGIDPIGLARAMYSNLVAGRTVQGGSTLTQQLAKNLFLSPDRTLERKVQEVLLAFWLEHNFTKDQILEMYLNRVYFGSGAYGVEAAARRYFQKPAKEVNLAEAALLAGLLKAPSRLSPARNPDLAEERGQVVLGAMQRAGFIDDREATTALTQPQTRAKSYWTGSENFAADRVMDDLKALIGDVKEDLIIETTIDFELQKKAEQVLRTTLESNGEKFNVKEGAIVAIDAGGAIQVLIGGRNYATSQFDRASEALRQPGSAFKPFVYTAALEQGETPNSIRNDAPVRIGKWTPQNYDEKYRGPVTLNEALAKSLNTIAAQLVVQVGPNNVAKTAKRMGIEAKLNTNASIALGTSEVTLLELTSSYAPFMNGGFKATPHIIKRISTTDGQLLFENVFDHPPRVLAPNVANQMNEMLTSVVTDGTGRNAQLPNWQVAGKTGTSQSFRDALFVGYTANLTAGVWLGNDDGASTKKVTGGGLPAKIWQAVMLHAHEGMSVASLPRVTSPTPLFGDPGSNIDELTDRLAPLPSSESTSSIPIPVSREAFDRGDSLRQTHLVPAKPLTGSTDNSNSGRPNSILDVILGR
ncbi:MAG: penicillin-binding protein [Rhizobiaceae bacterium]|nr:penicillin-binding protein [Rhizobiaceae bacterium]